MQTKFLLGALSMTPEARMVLKRLPYDLIARHAVNDYGTISDKQRETNEHSMKVIGPVVSRYRVDPTKSKTRWVRIETDATWGSTLVKIEP
jgi:hypothetical protein